MDTHDRENQVHALKQVRARSDHSHYAVRGTASQAQVQRMLFMLMYQHAPKDVDVMLCVTLSVMTLKAVCV